MSNTDALIADPARNATFEAELAVAPHAAQAAFWTLWGNSNHDGDALDVLRQAIEQPTRFTSPDAPLWPDAEIVSILNQAAKVDRVTGRALGHTEIMLLEQRDMIRKALRGY